MRLGDSASFEKSFLKMPNYFYRYCYWTKKKVAAQRFAQLQTKNYKLKTNPLSLPKFFYRIAYQERLRDMALRSLDNLSCPRGSDKVPTPSCYGQEQISQRKSFYSNKICSPSDLSEGFFIAPPVLSLRRALFSSTGTSAG